MGGETVSKRLTDREILAAWIRAHTNYKEDKIESILELYDKCPEVPA